MTTNTLTLTPDHPPTDAAHSPPINTEVLLARCMGNVSFALVLLSELEANGRKQVEVIMEHAAKNEWEAAAEAAHSLKGAAAILGAEPLRAAAAEIEATARCGEVSRLTDIVHDMSSEMDRCMAYIPILRTAAERRDAHAI
jgi:Amt family ammonium transporter